jgi:hypothetical protein
MKQLLNKRFIMTILPLLLLPLLSSCRDEVKSCNCDDKQNPFTVTRLEGTVFFYEEIQLWGISVTTEGGYDEVRVFFPCKPEKSYQVNNKKVVFSGNAYDFTDNITVPAGTEVFYIEISAISGSK